MAKCYGDLVMELWSGTQKSVAPLKLRVSCTDAVPPLFICTCGLVGLRFYDVFSSSGQ